MQLVTKSESEYCLLPADVRTFSAIESSEDGHDPEGDRSLEAQVRVRGGAKKQIASLDVHVTRVPGTNIDRLV